MTEQTQQQVTVAGRVLVKRINRKLASKMQAVRSVRIPATPDLGRYYLIDTTTTEIVVPDQDLEQLGRKLGALKPSERLHG